MPLETTVDEITSEAGSLGFRVRWLDGDAARVHRASISPGADLGAVLAAIEARAPDYPAISAEDAATLEGALAACPPAPAPPEPTLGEARAAAFARLAAIRYERQCVTTVNGTDFASDDKALGRINGKLTVMDLTGQTEVRWKVSSTQWVTLTRAHLIAVGVAIDAHWQACFAHEEVLALLIATAETAAEVAALDLEAGWPA